MFTIILFSMRGSTVGKPSHFLILPSCPLFGLCGCWCGCRFGFGCVYLMKHTNNRADTQKVPVCRLKKSTFIGRLSPPSSSGPAAAPGGHDPSSWVKAAAPCRSGQPEPRITTIIGTHGTMICHRYSFPELLSRSTVTWPWITPRGLHQHRQLVPE